MTKRIIMLTLGCLTCLLMATETTADEYAIHLTMGGERSYLPTGSQNIWVNPAVENQYAGYNNSSINLFTGIGASRRWQLNHGVEAIDIGFSIYHLEADITGINTPFINSGTYDTLKYSATDSSYAFMFEPTLIFAIERWQPFIEFGVGIARNDLHDYRETPANLNGTAAPTTTPFSSNTQTNFAYEVGVGLQYPLLDQPKSPLLALDWRYMNWGDLSLGRASGQTTHGPSVGPLSSSIISLKFVWLL